MLTTEQAAKIFDVGDSELDQFDVKDHFNNNNQLEGFLCRRSDHRYGALLIARVNGIEVQPQIVYATPKLHYPFDRVGEEGRQYKFPTAQKVEVYEKLDGTNICCYRYLDADGQSYVTFKTRMTVIVQDSKFGSFSKMWKEILNIYPVIRRPARVASGELTLSYELYGYRNPITIIYETPLDTRLLFGVRQQDAAILLPTECDNPKSEDALPKLVPQHTIYKSEKLVEAYESIREEANKQNTKILDGKVSGIEGYVFYLLDKNSLWQQFKCKSEIIEQLHWTSDVIPQDIIMATAINALESCDELTPEYLEQLLAEEFSVNTIKKSGVRIEKMLILLEQNLAFKAKVQQAFDLVAEELGLAQITTETKRNFMRAISQHFDKEEMKRVFAALITLDVVDPILFIKKKGKKS